VGPITTCPHKAIFVAFNLLSSLKIKQCWMPGFRLFGGAKN